jgi:predicted SAM-dependent methyltransferase
MSETSNCRSRLAKYCQGYGLDIGYGGDAIVPSAITVDLPVPYTNVGSHPLNLGGNAKDLFWFNSNVLDYVFSSHLLEDFEDTEAVLREWLRVLKPEGYLIIFCPDERVYREHCLKTGQSYNYAHKIPDFSLVYVRSILLDKICTIEVIHENPLVDTYSFEIVVRKKAKYNSDNKTNNGQLENINHSLDIRLKNAEASLHAIYNSTGWSVLQHSRKIIYKAFPANSRRYRLWVLTRRGISIWAKEGFWSLVRRASRKMVRRK